MSESKDCFVYIISKVEDGKHVSPVKVGISYSPGGRLFTFQTSCPFKLAIHSLFALPNRNAAQRIEQCFHQVQKRHQTHGEWFDIRPEIADVLVRMAIDTFLGIVCELTLEQREMAMETILVET